MKLVRNWNDIEKNLLTLEKYRRSSDPDEVRYYLDLVKRGTCFVVYDIGKEQVFSPSRFLGYLNNSQHAHGKNKGKDGRVTNPAIEAILGAKFSPNGIFDRQYRAFCTRLGIDAREKGSFGVERKFLYNGDETVISSEGITFHDLDALKSDKSIETTVKRQLMSARIGQGDFRKKLIKYWRGCCVTGCRNTSMLRASHIKPWRAGTNEERLDPYNGLLLTPNLDRAFDEGMISFNEKGRILISKQLSPGDKKTLGISSSMACLRLKKGHMPYLRYHREEVFVL